MLVTCTLKSAAPMRNSSVATTSPPPSVNASAK